MKELIAVVAVIILGIAVGGVIVGFDAIAEQIGDDAATLGNGVVAELNGEQGE